MEIKKRGRVMMFTNDKQEYERKLKEKQKRHLENIGINNWKPCRHDQCEECHGTGRKGNGEICVHFIYCDCPKCQPVYSV